MPIDPKDRFTLLSHAFAGDLLTFAFIDYDRRQYMSLTMAPESVPPVNPDDPDANIRARNHWESYAGSFLPGVCDSLGLEIAAFTVRLGDARKSASGGGGGAVDALVISTSSNTGSDHSKAPCPVYHLSYPTMKELGLDISGSPGSCRITGNISNGSCSLRLKTIKRSELFELERLGPARDLVSFRDRDAAGKEIETVAMFKYYFSPEGILRTVRDMQILAQIQQHRPDQPGVATLTHAVLDDSGKVVVGYLARPIPSPCSSARRPIFNEAGNDNSNKDFKLSWLIQLINLVDSLNLTYGLVGGGGSGWHSEIFAAAGPPESDSIILDSLAQSKPITPVYALHDVHLAVIAVYEAVTRQYDDGPSSSSFNPTRLGDLSPEQARKRAAEVLNMKEGDWLQPPDVRLVGGEIQDFKRTLEEWVDKRKWVHFPVRGARTSSLASLGAQESELSEADLYADEEVLVESRVGEKRKLVVGEGGQLRKRQRMRSETGRAEAELYLPAAEKKVELKKVKKIVEGRDGGRKECLLWDEETWKRDVTCPQPKDNPVVEWPRVPESKKKHGKIYLANGLSVDESEERSFQHGDGRFLDKGDVCRPCPRDSS